MHALAVVQMRTFCAICCLSLLRITCVYRTRYDSPRRLYLFFFLAVLFLCVCRLWVVSCIFGLTLNLCFVPFVCGTSFIFVSSMSLWSSRVYACASIRVDGAPSSFHHPSITVTNEPQNTILFIQSITSGRREQQ